MIVICLEGCHGSGKTELCKQFQKCGFETLDEGFMNMPSFGIRPQSLIMESLWISRWFERLLQMQKDHQTNSGSNDPLRKIFIADRSPYSGVYYAGSNGKLLTGVIRQIIEDLRTEANIQVVTVRLKVPEDVLWSRIQKRLKVEPERVKYNEGSKQWMQVTSNWYGQQEWDFVVENGENITFPELMDLLIKQLSNIPPATLTTSPRTDFSSQFVEYCRAQAPETVNKRKLSVV